MDSDHGLNFSNWVIPWHMSLLSAGRGNGWVDRSVYCDAAKSASFDVPRSCHATGWRYIADGDMSQDLICRHHELISVPRQCYQLNTECAGRSNWQYFWVDMKYFRIHQVSLGPVSREFYFIKPTLNKIGG